MSLKEMLTGAPDNKDIHKAAPVPERLQRGEKVVIITDDNVEDIEFFYPYYRLTEEGYEVHVATPNGGAFKGKHGIGIDHSLKIESLRPEDYELLYIPGGRAPASLRKDEKVLAFVKEFAASGRPIAAACHGPQILISADLVEGIEMACWPGVKDELEKAGGIFVNEALVEDRQFITARMPGDLHRHLYGVLQYLEGGMSEEPRRPRRGEHEQAGARP